MRQNIFRQILKEPLFHFLFAGLVIFLIAGYAASKRKDHTIIIDKNLIGKLSIAWRTQYGNLPNEKELKLITDEYIRQEILVREAKALGLDTDDEIVRRRLAQKMEFLQKDNLIIEDPDNEELEKYFRKNESKFMEPEMVTFTHIYFSPDRGGNDSAIKRAEQVLKYLTSNSSIIRSAESGDRFSLAYDYNGVDMKESISLFGDSPFSDSLFTVTENTWRGPFRSGYGWHLVYINSRSKPAVPPLDEIKSKVVENYKTDILEEKNNEEFSKLFDKYSIEIKTE